MADLPFLRASENGTDYGNNDYFGDAGQNDFLLDEQDAFQDQEQVLQINKINAFLQSDNVYTRQAIARNLMDCLQRATTADERQTVLNAVKRLACDAEPSVKAECMEQLPRLIIYCHENQGAVDPQDAVGNYLLQATVCSLHDNTNQVRKSAQMALLNMLEHRLISEVDLEELVFPSLLELLLPDSVSEDLRVETVGLFTKAFLLVTSPDIMERVLLPKFCELCADNVFHVRKACASSFGDICSVVGPKLTEEVLLPRFLALCEDGVWGVRKACAECFMPVSSSCSVTARAGDLAKAFSTLLNDQSRWVRTAAFQALGPFISTFAGQNLALFIDETGALRVREPVLVRPPQLLSKPEESSNDSVPETHVLASGVSSSIPCGTPNTSVFGADLCTSSIIDNKNPEKKSKTDDDASLEELMWQMFHATGGTSSANDEKLAAINGSAADSQTPTLSVRNAADSQTPTLGVKNADDPGQYSSLAYWREPLPDIEIPPPVVTLEHAVVDTKTLDCNGDKTGGKSADIVHQPTPQAVITAAINNGSCTTVDDDLDQLANNLAATLMTVHPEATAANKPSLPGHDSYSSSGTIDAEKIPLPDSGTKVFDYSAAAILPEFQMSSFNSFTARTCTRRSSSGSSCGEPVWAESHVHDQDVVPPVLLENYLSMAEPSKAQSVDTDIARHCAFSFPAVAYTLGKDNWRCLKGLYDALAGDMQWKVRRTLAFSIHDIAIILGPEATERDLIPVFDGFLKDLDEVKIGVLKHLADFVKLMDPKLRKNYLPRYKDFLATDNTRNWRFRFDLAEQMIHLVDLYSPDDVYEYLAPLGVTLLSDRVAEVRQMTYSFVSKVVKRLQEDVSKNLRLMLVNDLIAKFARSQHWLQRQMFVHVCGVLLDDEALLPEQLAKELLPSVLALTSDPVPNVRMAVSKFVFVSLARHDYFFASTNPHHVDLAAACTTLRGDSDRDVRYYACPPIPGSDSVEIVNDGSAECLAPGFDNTCINRECDVHIDQN